MVSTSCTYFLRKLALGIALLASLEPVLASQTGQSDTSMTFNKKVWLGISGAMIIGGSGYYYFWLQKQIKQARMYGESLCRRPIATFTELQYVIALMDTPMYAFKYNKELFRKTIVNIIPTIIRHECTTILKNTEGIDLDDYKKQVNVKLESKIKKYHASEFTEHQKAYARVGFNFNDFMDQLRKQCNERAEDEFNDRLTKDWARKLSKTREYRADIRKSAKENIINFLTELNHASSIPTESMSIDPSCCTLRYKFCNEKAAPMPHFYDYCGDVQWDQLYKKANRGNIKQHKARLQKIDALILGYRLNHNNQEGDDKDKEALLCNISSSLEPILEPFQSKLVRGLTSEIPGIPYTTLEITDLEPCKSDHIKYPVEIDKKELACVENDLRRAYVQYKIKLGDLLPYKKLWLQGNSLDRLPALRNALHLPPSLEENLPFALNAKNDLLEIPATITHEAAHIIQGHTILKQMLPDSGTCAAALRSQACEYTADVISFAALQDERYSLAYIREALVLQLQHYMLTDLLRDPVTGKFYELDEIASWCETEHNRYGYTQEKIEQYYSGIKLRSHPIVARRMDKYLTAWAAYEIYCNSKSFDEAVSYVGYKTKNLFKGFDIRDAYINDLLINFVDGWKNEQRILSKMQP